MVPLGGLPPIRSLASLFAGPCFFSHFVSLLLNILQHPLLTSRVKSNLLSLVTKPLPSLSPRSPFQLLLPLHASTHPASWDTHHPRHGVHVGLPRLLCLLFALPRIFFFPLSYSFIPLSRLSSVVTPF